MKVATRNHIPLAQSENCHRRKCLDYELFQNIALIERSRCCGQQPPLKTIAFNLNSVETPRRGVSTFLLNFNAWYNLGVRADQTPALLRESTTLEIRVVSSGWVTSK